MKKILLVIFLIIHIPVFSQISWDNRFDSFYNDWKGVPYKYGGTTKKGIDCSAFTQKIFKDLYQIDIPRTSSRQFKFTDKIIIDSLIFGDLVFFKSRLSPSGWHVGFYIGSLRFLHAANKKDDIKISSLNEDRYRRTFLGGGRVSLLWQKLAL